MRAISSRTWGSALVLLASSLVLLSVPSSRPAGTALPGGVVGVSAALVPTLNVAMFLYVASNTTVLDPNITIPLVATADLVQSHVSRGVRLWRDTVNVQGGLTLFANTTVLINVTFFSPGAAAASGSDAALITNAAALLDRIALGEFGSYPVFLTNPSSSTTMNAALMQVCERRRTCVFIHPLAATTSLFVCGGSGTAVPADCTNRQRRSGQRRFDYSFSPFPAEGQTFTPFINLMTNKNLKTLVILPSSADAFAIASTSVSVATAQSNGIDVMLVDFLQPSAPLNQSQWSQDRWNSYMLNISTNYNPDALALFPGSAAINGPLCIGIFKAMKAINWFPKAGYIGACSTQTAADKFVKDNDMMRYWFTTQPWDERLRGQQFRVFSQPGIFEPFEATATEDSPQVFSRLGRNRWPNDFVAMASAFGAFSGLMAQKALEYNPQLPVTADTIKDGMNRLAQPSHMGTMQFDPWGRLVPVVFTFMQFGPASTLYLLTPIPGGIDPIVPTPTWDEREYTRTALFASTPEYIVVALTGVCIAIVLGFLAMTMYHRKNGVILAATPVFCGFTLCGAIVLMCSNFVWTLHETDVTCQAKIWLLQLGFTLLFSSMLIKTLRIWNIFYLRKLQVVRISTVFLTISLTAVLAAETIFTLIWHYVSPYTAQIVEVDPLRPSKNYTTCTSNAHGNDFVIAAIIIKFLLMGVSGVAAWSVRKVPSEFQESTFILASIWNVTFLMLIGVPVVITSSDRMFSFYVRTLGILLLCVSTVCFVFIPKFIKLREGEGAPQSYYRDKNGAGHTMGTKVDDSNHNSNTNQVQRMTNARLQDKLHAAQALLQRIRGQFPVVANCAELQDQFAAVGEPSAMGGTNTVAISVQQPALDRAVTGNSAKNRSVNDSHTPHHHPTMGGRAPSNMGMTDIQTQGVGTPSARAGGTSGGANDEGGRLSARQNYRVATGQSGTRTNPDRPSLMVGNTVGGASGSPNPNTSVSAGNGNGSNHMAANTTEMGLLPGQLRTSHGPTSPDSTATIMA